MDPANTFLPRFMKEAHRRKTLVKGRSSEQRLFFFFLSFALSCLSPLLKKKRIKEKK